MARTYIRKLGARRYVDYTPEQVSKAVTAVKRGMTLRLAQNTFKIPIKTISNKTKEIHNKPIGGQIALSQDKELEMVKLLKVCGEWGQALDTIVIRMIAKMILDKSKENIDKFKNNLPSEKWARLFLKRHKAEVKLRKSQHIKRSRAEKSSFEINQYFDQLEQSLLNIRPENIINYDETNLSDDPGRKCAIFKRGTKYPERIQNFTNGATSIMFSGTATGELLPLYVVYKAEHLWDTWCVGGPARTRYNRTKSGWFDSSCFHDWFVSIVIPFVKRRNGPKALIGDNLSSHFNQETVKLCEENDIKFIMLPQNATHLTQPLDVAFFGPLKKKWRSVLTQFKFENSKMSSLSKDCFPTLLEEFMNSLQNSSRNLVSGFRATGIFPLDRSKVLKRLPQEQEGIEIVGEALVEHLKHNRSPDQGHVQQRRKKLKVTAGKSICLDDFKNKSDDTNATEADGEHTSHEEERRTSSSDKRGLARHKINHKK